MAENLYQSPKAEEKRFRSPLWARIVSACLIGALAGAIPIVGWYVWIEITRGFVNGLGGLAVLAALIAGALFGAVAGAVLGAIGHAVPRVTPFSLALALLLACAGAALGAFAGKQAVGLGEELSVGIVLFLQTIGLATGLICASRLSPM